MKTLLTKLPIAYKGKLLDVRFINFSVEMDELRPMVPKCMRIADFGGKGIVSMADLKVWQMRPKLIPTCLSFSYRHIALRILVDGPASHSRNALGIYFLKSFSDKPWIVKLGNCLTHYRLNRASSIREPGLELTQGRFHVCYKLGGPMDEHQDPLYRKTARLNRAYAVNGNEILLTFIKPKVWPIIRIGCKYFETNMFRSAALLGAYKTNGPINFERSAPVVLN